MTERMYEDQLDREIGRFLAWEADDVGAVPPASEVALRIGSRVGTHAAGPRLSPRSALIVLVAVLIVALAGGIVAVGMLLRQSNLMLPKSRAYEAVFVRPGALVAGATEVIVAGVNAEGRERVIATLGGVWVPVAGPKVPPGAAVSPGGLLAMASNSGDAGAGKVRWEIFDLHRPLVDPIVIPGIQQWYEEPRDTPYFRPNGRGGAFWGPAETLALLWYHLPYGGVPDLQLAIIDGRTGRTVPVLIPDDLAVLPYWASDGSGIFVSANAEFIDPPGTDPSQILRTDGSVIPMAESLAEASCRTPQGFLFACLAPNDSMIFDYGDIASGSPSPGLIATATGSRFEIDGSFIGWLEVDP